MSHRTTLILVFLSGMVAALIATLLPNFNLWSLQENKRQLRQIASPGIQSVSHIALTLPFAIKRKDGDGHAQYTTDHETEALSAIHLAKEMINYSKLEKALKLLNHAVALCPNHPDILTEYGEFMERHKQDILSAEHLYSKALVFSPDHKRALLNKDRTLPLVEEIDQTTFNRVDKKRDLLMAIPPSHPGLRRMKQESYYQHIHHTTAIEGNTFTLSQTRSIVETRVAIGGKSIIEHNEILGLDAALSFLNSTLVQRIGRITKQDILDIHRRVLGFVDPVEAGKFRNTQVFVGDFIPPPAVEIPSLMDEFIDWLNSDEALGLHPIEHAALAHYRFVIIHPFYDGNGRTSRLLMNLILMQAGYPPITILKEEKHKYFKYLEQGNDGDIRPFIRFIAKVTERTLDEYLWVSSDSPNITFPGLSEFRDDGRTIIMEEDDER